MDPLLDKLDETVEGALQKLFPPAEKTAASRDAEQRAQDFAAQVSLVHGQFAELKSKLELPVVSNTPRAKLEKEIADLRKDIRLKDAALSKYRAVLNEHVEKLRQIDSDNRRLIENIGGFTEA
ncbi:hypothetical protein LPJ79_003507 [Coemansia sp. RSA 1821]|nr:hypothetical protein LPJ79_003507 [Coemansia sp. RSA 1821]